VVTKQHQSPGHSTRASALIKVVRESTERFQDVSVAQAEGYVLQFGCVSGSDSGAMGLHFVNGDLVNAGVIDATRPQIVIYEPMPDGRLRLVGADYLVLADAWNAKNSGPPQLISIYSRVPIASGYPRSTRYMCGRGRRIPMVRL